MKTRVEIDTEAATLEKMKPTVRQRSGFGDDHHETIDAQIQVLRDCMSHDDIYDAWGDEDMEKLAQNVLDAAIAAHEWMTGRNKEAPNLGWQSRVR